MSFVASQINMPQINNVFVQWFLEANHKDKSSIYITGSLWEESTVHQ